jgi:hypothetical protein
VATPVTDNTEPPKRPPRLPVRWETIQREWDKDGHLISEKITTTTEVDNSPPAPPEPRRGFYL